MTVSTVAVNGTAAEVRDAVVSVFSDAGFSHAGSAAPSGVPCAVMNTPVGWPGLKAKWFINVTGTTWSDFVIGVINCDTADHTAGTHSGDLTLDAGAHSSSNYNATMQPLSANWLVVASSTAVAIFPTTGNGGGFAFVKTTSYDGTQRSFVCWNKRTDGTQYGQRMLIDGAGARRTAASTIQGYAQPLVAGADFVCTDAFILSSQTSTDPVVAKISNGLKSASSMTERTSYSVDGETYAKYPYCDFLMR